jgi:multidrug transporter EmrE-like cation transporter
MNRAGFLLVLAGVLLNAVAQLSLKAATAGSGPIGLDLPGIAAGLSRVALVPWFWLGGASYALSIVIWLLALSRLPVSVAYPMLSIGYIVNAIAARLWLGEDLGAVRLVGIGIIIVGVFVLAQARMPGSHP